ncbi:MAG: lysylphosphatidylglycerol synthase transmembrane domain-containing protein [Rhodothermales bacterium]
MSPRQRSLIAQIASFVLAGVLLYLSLRGVDFGAMLGALRRADYRWLVPLAGVALFSHWLRAWRWQVLIRALPDEETASDGRPPTTGGAFSSLMIGYMVNYAAPRLGEIARTANLSARTHIGFSSLFGTVVVERILDVIVLALALASVFVLLIDRAATIDRLFLTPLTEQLGRIPAIALGAGIAVVAILVLLLYRTMLRRDASSGAPSWADRARPVLLSFRDGIATLVRSPERGTLVISTIGIWLFYTLMAYLPFVMLGMVDAYDLSFVDAWSIMILGAVGVAIPSPGGVGSYHYITIQSLVYLFAVSQEAAASYAVLSHAAQLVLYVATGAICLVLQGSSLHRLRLRTIAAKEDRSD